MNEHVKELYVKVSGRLVCQPGDHMWTAKCMSSSSISKSAILQSVTPTIMQRDKVHVKQLYINSSHMTVCQSDQVDQHQVHIK